MSITLFCLIKGDIIANAFAIDINKEKLVSHLKKVIKEAVAESLQENRELFQEMITEALEDVGLLRAMEIGRKTKLVPREKINEILRGKK